MHICHVMMHELRLGRLGRYSIAGPPVAFSPRADFGAKLIQYLSVKPITKTSSDRVPPFSHVRPHKSYQGERQAARPCTEIISETPFFDQRRSSVCRRRPQISAACLDFA